MEIVHYPHPVLRFKSGDVAQIDDRLRETIRQMFDLMYSANGVGLAANQVGIPLRFFVMNPEGDPEDKESELVFINPVIRNRKGAVVGEEGCLSLPKLYGDVRRGEEIVVEAFDIEGQGFRATLQELPARVVQHETDHLDGVLFIDRISDDQRAELLPKLAEFEEAYEGPDVGSPEVLNQLRATAASGRLP
jgi:peptide deformylase